jgi:hypothetical protein
VFISFKQADMAQVAQQEQDMNYTSTLSFQAQAHTPIFIRSAFAQLFNRAVFRARCRQVVAWFFGRSTQLQSLKSTSQNSKNRLPAVQQVALDDIVGSEGRCHDFDNQFLPLRKHNCDRWTNIALARHKQVVLPLVQLIHTDAGYFVRDGHHRISVARIHGQAMIEAMVVSAWQ